LLPFLFYGYAAGVLSSRKLEQATDGSVAFRFIRRTRHPGHDTIASFHKRFFEESERPVCADAGGCQAHGTVQAGH